jgi:D-threo-aldose 1-dehydrogenase
VNRLPKRRLGRTDVKLTVLGLGGSSIGNLYRPVPEGDAAGAIDSGWRGGIRYFDTAPLYGNGLGEHRVGRVLGQHRRDRFVLSTKIGRMLSPLGPGAAANLHSRTALPFAQAYDYSYDGALRSLDDSLQRLGLGCIDVALIHDIDADHHGPAGQKRRYREAMEGTYPALAKLRDEGVLKAIGVGTNDWRVCERCANDTDFDCFVLAGRYTLLEQGALASFLPLCARKGIGVICAAPFNSGILARGATGSAKYNEAAPPPGVRDKIRRIERVCKRHGVNMAAAALQFPLAHRAIASVLPGVRGPAQVEQNLRLFQDAIPAEFWLALVSEGLLDAAAPVPKSRDTVPNTKG